MAGEGESNAELREGTELAPESAAVGENSANGKEHVLDIEEKTTLRKALGRVDAMALIISGIIGSGIFTSPGVLLSDVGGDAMLAMLIWIIGSVLAACLGFVYAELGTLIPNCGGEYAYFRAAFGDAISFAYIFKGFWVSPGSMGIIALTFARYLYGRFTYDDSTFYVEFCFPLKFVDHK